MEVLGIKFKKSQIVIVAATLTLAVSFFPFQNSVKNFSSLGNIADGSQVCFSRVIQSFTAKMLGDGASPYLSKSFLNLTGQCYSDVLDSYQNKLAPSFEGLYGKITRLNNDLSWFNQRLDTKVINLSNQANAGSVIIQNKFRALESSNEDLARSIEGSKANLSSSLTIFGTIIGSAILFLIGALFTEIRHYAMTNRKKEEAERLASKELNSQILTPERVQRIIGNVLAAEKLEECQTLFARFGAEISTQIGKGFVTNRVYDEQASVLNEEVKMAKHSSLSKSKSLDSNEVAVTENANLLKLNLSQFTAKIIERLKPQIYAYGVLIDVDVDEEMNLWAREEGLLQVIFDSLSKSLKSSIQSSDQPRVKVSAKTLGGTVVLRVLHNGADFSQNELISMKKKGYEKGLSTEIMIIKELMEDFGGKLEIKNKPSKMKELKLIFKRAKSTYVSNSREIATRKVVRSVQKGTKKEILANISQ